MKCNSKHMLTVTESMKAWIMCAILTECILCVALGGLAALGQTTSQGAYNGPPRHHPEDWVRVIYSSPAQRINLLSEQVLRTFPTGKDHDLLTAGLKLPLTVDGLKGVSKVLNNWENQDLYWPLLATIYSADNSRDVKTFVREEFDAFYDKIVKDNGPEGDTIRRESSWTEMLYCLEGLGNQDLLTDKFWSAVKAEKFLVGKVLALYASPRAKAELAKYVKSLNPDDVLFRLTKDDLDDVSIMLDFPELRSVNSRFLGPVLEELRSRPPEKRPAMIKELVADARRQMKEEAQAVCSQPSTLPVPTSNSSTQPTSAPEK